MAGGLGSRMQSDVPKVLHKVGGIPMLVRVITEALKLDPKNILVVVGEYKPMIEKVLKEYGLLSKIDFVIQEEPLGTGHAVKQCIPYLDNVHEHKEQVLVLSGDVPLLTAKTMNDMLCSGFAKVLTVCVANPKGYGRIILDGNGDLKRIVEEKDCSPNQKMVNLVNTGIYSFRSSLLVQYIDDIDCKNAQNEYYLTDMIAILRKNFFHVRHHELPVDSCIEVMGINTKEQLQRINARLSIK